MTRMLVVLCALAALSAGAARAAESWALPNEEIVRFEAAAVDVLCELTGDCPADCGGGARQMGLLTDGGELILPYKNQVIFAGAAGELAEFCGKRVVADGLFSANRGHKVFALQFLREAPDGEWRRANRWLAQWARENGVDPESDTASQWFRNDPRIQRIIEAQGPTGLGPDVVVE